MILLHNSINRRKAQPSAFSYFLGGEERFEDSCLRRGIHADTGIADDELNVASRGDADGVLLRKEFSQAHEIGLYR